MPVYHVGVVRSYKVHIEAEDPDKAQELATFFISSDDASTDEERKQFNFKFHKIELIENNSFSLD